MPTPKKPIKHRCPLCKKLRRDVSRVRGNNQDLERFPPWEFVESIGSRICGLCVRALNGSKFGIALTADGSPDASIVGWRSRTGIDETWDSYSEALEANDLGGWTGYVRFYPSGDKVPNNQLEKEQKNE